MDIKDRLIDETRGHSMYKVRREEYKKDNSNINFRVTNKPFKLTKSQKVELENIGKAICCYMDGCIELYKTNEIVHKLLDRGKPKEYRNVSDVKYLFLRPDLIMTDTEFCVCEIETSPFGLSLAEVLNRTYGNAGFDTVVQENSLKNYLQAQTGKTGTVAYTEKVSAFSGQLDFMAEELLSGNGKKWDSKQIETSPVTEKEIYRAFYLSEQFSNPEVQKLLNEPHIYTPSSTPQFEEKALLSFIWDNRFTEFLQNQLGDEDFNLLRRIIPKTWILGEEEFVDGGLPNNFSSSLDLATLGKASRKYVLKQSGFQCGSSWGEGVCFLHKMGGNRAKQKIEQAYQDEKHLYIIQEFKQGKVVPMEFVEEGESNKKTGTINAKIRITPYYSYLGKSKGSLIAAKVTGCEDTEYIHASTASVNTSLSYDERD